jgi:hypothetical protein
MGYGGNLIWTSVFAILNQRDGVRLSPVHLPGLSDLVRGLLYDRSIDLSNDAIYCDNPRLAFMKVRAKGAAERAIDGLFARVVAAAGQRERFERWVLARAEANRAGQGLRLIHVDMRLHSYAARQTRRRTIWKPANRATEGMLEHLGGGGEGERKCEIFFRAEEHAQVDRLLRENGVSADFLVFDSATNRDYFGELRAWPIERWRDALAQLKRAFPALTLVQIGLGGEPASPDVVDLRGKTSFRLACLVMARARLFVGTEGGLMHAASAVGARALILWGGLTDPEFIGYPRQHRIICKHVACAPCGNNGWCDNGHVCMRNIAVDEVVDAASEELRRP